MGETYRSLGKLDEALKYYEKYNELEKELHEAYPSNVEFKNNLAISYIKLNQVLKKIDKPDEARGVLLLSEKHYLELVAIAPQYVSFQQNLDWVQRRLSDG